MQAEIIAAIAACIGLLAVLIAYRSAITAEKALKTQIVLDFAKRDADPVLGAATKILWDFKRENVENISERFSKLKTDGSPRWKEIDNARRLVFKYYLQLMKTKQAKLISKEEILICLDKPNLETVIEILEPLESKKRGYDYSKPIFKEYRELYSGL